jgi:6-phosphogluconolactonase
LPPIPHRQLRSIRCNGIVVFSRDFSGRLTPAGTYATGGLGTGGGIDPLAAQNSLIISGNKRWLVAANAGSNDISVFRVRRNFLVFAVDEDGLTEDDPAVTPSAGNDSLSADKVNVADGSIRLRVPCGVRSEHRSGHWVRFRAGGSA